VISRWRDYYSKEREEEAEDLEDLTIIGLMLISLIN